MAMVTGRAGNVSPERVPRRRSVKQGTEAARPNPRSRPHRGISDVRAEHRRTSEYSKAALANAVAEELGVLLAPLPPKEEETTRKWLRALQLEVDANYAYSPHILLHTIIMFCMSDMTYFVLVQVLSREETGQLLDNPLRNGVLLCEVVGKNLITITEYYPLPSE